MELKTSLRGGAGHSTGTLRRRELFYDTIAEQFDDVMNQYDVQRRLEVVFDELLAEVELRGRRVLDAGCGTGRFSEEACRRGANVTSVDIGPKLLQQVRRKCDARPMCGDVRRLAFGDESFDVVISSECIEHTPWPGQAVAELFRVCRTGGFVAITCPNRFWGWSCVLANLFGLRAYQGLENWPGWFQLQSWIGTAGGKVLIAKGVHLFPFVLKGTQPLLRRLDRFGRTLGPMYLNQAVLATK